MESEESLRPAPDAALLAGALIAVAGYLLPWFNQEGYAWSYSGWSYASLSTGGGWTLLTLGFLAVAVVASLWAGRSVAAAMWALGATVGAGFFALVVVAASFSNIEEQGSTNYLSSLPFNAGLPLLAAGLGLALAGGCRAIVAGVLRRG
ncbi:hypothetical protein [Jiangella anatolica]|uniref:Uncharacterized protein n=1 Tax=Jiangella anatolica TaxID=2670374 RepID=A0A2W2BHL0_9ACTN|nr:hypothetical protein [Jiangella anatolica]PZF79778.1 hypothetical protein C1I92_29400 [Jiangella anatolica]